MQAGGVDDDELALVQLDDAADHPASSLRLVSRDMAIFLPTIALTNVDLPAFGRPTTDTKPARKP